MERIVFWSAENRHYAIADIFVDMTLVNMNYLSDITEVFIKAEHSLYPAHAL